MEAPQFGFAMDKVLAKGVNPLKWLVPSKNQKEVRLRADLLNEFLEVGSNVEPTIFYCKVRLLKSVFARPRPSHIVFNRKGRRPYECG